jgi:hypothetical protein
MVDVVPQVLTQFVDDLEINIEVMTGEEDRVAVVVDEDRRNL